MNKANSDKPFSKQSARCESHPQLNKLHANPHIQAQSHETPNLKTFPGSCFLSSLSRYMRGCMQRTCHECLCCFYSSMWVVDKRRALFSYSIISTVIGSPDGPPAFSISEGMTGTPEPHTQSLGQKLHVNPKPSALARRGWELGRRCAYDGPAWYAARQSLGFGSIWDLGLGSPSPILFNLPHTSQAPQAPIGCHV